MTDDRLVRMLRVSESDPVQQEAADEIERLTAELAAAKERASKYQRIAAELTDRLNGTPCAEIRWQQERDALRALLREAREYTGYAAFYGDRIEADHAVDLCARIDAALNEGGGNE